MNRFNKYAPGDILKPYIKYFVIAESEQEKAYKVLPDTSLVIGFQYKGKLAKLTDENEITLSAMGITGLQSGYNIFKNSADIGTVLVYFKETALPAFFNIPANELFEQSVSLDNFFNISQLEKIGEQLVAAETDVQRIRIVELFLIAQLKYITDDLMVAAAIAILNQSKGTMRIKDMAAMLHMSQSPLEKRFRRVVGTSPKRFASIIRLQSLINDFPTRLSMTEIGYRIGYYDQAHFIKDFKNFTGETPEKFFQPK